MGKRIWDWPVILFHWALLAGVVYTWLQHEEMDKAWHMRGGLAVLTLVLFRVIWGFVGSGTARFSQFVKGPKAVLVYVRHFVTADKSNWMGHAPLGGWSVVALLVLLLIQALTGLFAKDDIISRGPLADFVSNQTVAALSDWHEVNFALLTSLILLHLVAVLYYAIRKRENLVRPMITGWRKDLKAEEGEEDNATGFVSPWRALVVLIAVIAVVWGPLYVMDLIPQPLF